MEEKKYICAYKGSIVALRRTAEEMASYLETAPQTQRTGLEHYQVYELVPVKMETKTVIFFHRE